MQQTQNDRHFIYKVCSAFFNVKSMHAWLKLGRIPIRMNPIFQILDHTREREREDTNSQP